MKCLKFLLVGLVLVLIPLYAVQAQMKFEIIEKDEVPAPVLEAVKTAYPNAEIIAYEKHREYIVKSKDYPCLLVSISSGSEPPFP